MTQSPLKYDVRYPSVADLKIRAKKRMPSFAFDYVDGAMDEELGKKRNRDAFRDIQLIPRYLEDVGSVDITTSLFGHRYSMPFGVPPVGLGNMMWPGAEIALARSAQAANIPYIFSTFSTTLLEDIAAEAPDVAWFQLYVPKKEWVMEELINRAKRSGFKALVVTLDIPVGAKRNRELKNQLKLPFSFTPNIIWQSLTHPTWAIKSLIGGMPDFVNILPYKDTPDQRLAEFMSSFAMAGVTLERLKKIRSLWDGPLILKGIQYQKNALDALNIGVDGFIVSNHGGRQIEAAPSSVDTLKCTPAQVLEKSTVMIDSGIRTGLDVIRAKALGAEFGFSGRSFFYGMGALGAKGGDQVIEIFRDEITRSLQQLGCLSFEDMDHSWLA